MSILDLPNEKSIAQHFAKAKQSINGDVNSYSTEPNNVQISTFKNNTSGKNI